MKVEIAFTASETKKITFQDDFPTTTDCCRCDGESRMAFIAHETDEPKKAKYVCQLWKNDFGKKSWLHDACCVAVYFCKKCLEPTALWNQA